MFYNPAKAPSDPDDLSSYLENELEAIASALTSNIISIDMTPTHQVPTKPRTGLVAYADGTDWNPGSGEGLYVYGSDAAWHFLESISPSLPLSVANGGTGDTGSGWTSYVVTVTKTTGTATAVGFWKAIGKTVFLSVKITYTSALSGATGFNLPVASIRDQFVGGVEIALTFHAFAAKLSASSASAVFFDSSTGGTATANGTIVLFTGVYESV